MRSASRLARGRFSPFTFPPLPSPNMRGSRSPSSHAAHDLPDPACLLCPCRVAGEPSVPIGRGILALVAVEGRWRAQADRLLHRIGQFSASSKTPKTPMDEPLAQRYPGGQLLLVSHSSRWRPIPRRACARQLRTPAASPGRWSALGSIIWSIPALDHGCPHAGRFGAHMQVHSQRWPSHFLVNGALGVMMPKAWRETAEAGQGHGQATLTGPAD